jgi:hypothetical protein
MGDQLNKGDTVSCVVVTSRGRQELMLDFAFYFDLIDRWNWGSGVCTSSLTHSPMIHALSETAKRFPDVALLRSNLKGL